MCLRLVWIGSWIRFAIHCIVVQCMGNLPRGMGSSMFMSLLFFFFNHTPTTEIYTYCHTLSLHDALPICFGAPGIEPQGKIARSTSTGPNPERIRAVTVEIIW